MGGFIRSLLVPTGALVALIVLVMLLDTFVPVGGWEWWSITLLAIAFFFASLTNLYGWIAPGDIRCHALSRSSGKYSGIREEHFVRLDLVAWIVSAYFISASLVSA